MNDLYLQWGGDLAAGSGGDIAVATGTDTINQRLYRRLLTNPGDYIWNLNYGGGLGQFVGAPANTAAIAAVIRAQIGLETAIPSTPAPTIDATVTDPAAGYVVASITYTDPSSQRAVQVNVSTE